MAIICAISAPFSNQIVHKNLEKIATSLIIKTPKFEETEGDCGQTVNYGTGKGIFTIVKKLLQEFFSKYRSVGPFWVW